MQHADTICAISSAAGPADRMIVRLSGPRCRALLADLLLSPSARTRDEGGAEGRTRGGVADKETPGKGTLQDSIDSRSPKESSPRTLPREQGEGGAFLPAQATCVSLHFAALEVPAIVYTFVAPHSVTGEDVAELHIPGNPLLTRLLLSELIGQGARPAEPGEFTARGYFNGKLDLPQAEAVATLISAENASELSAARKSLGGELARWLTPLMHRLAETLAITEAAIDFSEEEIEFASLRTLQKQIDAVALDLTQLLAQSARFERLSHEPSVMLVGRPNAGKSSLLNALVGQQRAVVSGVAGTTRDALSARLELPRGPVRLIDAAGWETAHRALDALMQDRARAALESADLFVLLRDVSDPAPPLSLPRPATLKLASKADLGGEVMDGELPISIHDRGSLDVFCDRLDTAAFGKPFASDALALNARHVRWIRSAIETLSGIDVAGDAAAVEIIAADLRRALNDLGEVLGQITPDDVLGKVFANFCVGK